MGGCDAVVENDVSWVISERLIPVVVISYSLSCSDMQSMT